MGSEPGNGLGPRNAGLGAKCLRAGLLRRVGGIAERQGRSGEPRRRKRGMIFHAFQTGWLNRWVRALRIVKIGQLVNY